jgi:hypothetical protein
MPTVHKIKFQDADWSLPDAGAIREEIRRREDELKTLRNALSALAAAKRLLRSTKDSHAARRKKNPDTEPSVPGAPTGIRQAIREASQGLKQPFTAADVLRVLENRNFQFGEDPKAAVRDALYVLAKRESGLKRVQKGAGGKPNLYERVA